MPSCSSFFNFTTEPWGHPCSATGYIEDRSPRHSHIPCWPPSIPSRPRPRPTELAARGSGSWPHEPSVSAGQGSEVGPSPRPFSCRRRQRRSRRSRPRSHWSRQPRRPSSCRVCQLCPTIFCTLHFWRVVRWSTGGWVGLRTRFESRRSDRRSGQYGWPF